MMVWVLEKYTEPDSIVADFYAGSGTTGVACVRTGRRFIGVEQSPTHFATAVRRITDAIRAKSEQLVA
jgi:site-specific DNA-methyltransferase (adenine-specific)